jgi:hypothetical protein
MNINEYNSLSSNSQETDHQVVGARKATSSSSTWLSELEFISKGGDFIRGGQTIKNGEGDHKPLSLDKWKQGKKKKTSTTRHHKWKKFSWIISYKEMSPVPEEEEK